MPAFGGSVEEHTEVVSCFLLNSMETVVCLRS